MFWKKRKSPTEQVKADTDAIVRSLGPKWRMFCETLIFKEDVPLWQRIELFANPALEFMFQNYPSMKHAPPKLLWMMIFTAILESKTHPTEEVNTAICQVLAKYARG